MMLRSFSHFRPNRIAGVSLWMNLPATSNGRCYSTNHAHSAAKLCDRDDSALRRDRLRSPRRVNNFPCRNSSGGSGDGQSKSLATPPFQKLVQALKQAKQTCTILESSCGGLISSSLMGVPGSSGVFFGSTIAYNTKRSGPLLCGGEELHRRLMAASDNAGAADDAADIDVRPDLSEATKDYVRAKISWTRDAALSYCDRMGTDFAIAEGGATGPTFHPEGMESGFAVVAVAGRRRKGEAVEILAQEVVYSSHADREANMRLFADAAADLCAGVVPVASPPVAETPKSAGVGAVVEGATPKSAGVGAVVDETDDVIFDRSSALRTNEALMKEFYRREDAQHVVIRGTDEVLFASSTQLALPTLRSLKEDAALAGLMQTTGTGSEEILGKRTFLGRLGASQTPVFALFLPEDACIDVGGRRDRHFARTRPHAPFLTPTHNELALTASAYANWRAADRFCSASGSPLEYVHAGTCARGVDGDGKPHLHWPRQDPSIITLVVDRTSTHALLARSPRHPAYLYTALAGFVEAGETFERAVAREVMEEVGVAVDPGSVGYVASQPWPFPRSCMIGMTARSSEDGLAPITIDPDEILDARWFEKEVVYRAARDADEMGAVMDPRVVKEKQASGEWNGKLLVPSKGVLARTLVDHWLEND